MSRDFLPYAWGVYWPNWVDWSITFASFCLFFLFFLLFVKFVPSVAMTEVKEDALYPIHQKEDIGGNAMTGFLPSSLYADDFLLALRRLRAEDFRIETFFSPVRLPEAQEIV